jgi:hypothetical protein
VVEDSVAAEVVVGETELLLDIAVVVNVPLEMLVDFEVIVVLDGWAVVQLGGVVVPAVLELDRDV